MADDENMREDEGQPFAEPVSESETEQPESERKLVLKIASRIKADKKHFEPVFKRMRRDMKMAMHGADPEKWPEANYKANVIGRHVKQKVASLYAKNPRVVAKKRERMDFAVWDEQPDSLALAMQTVQAYGAMQASMPPMASPEQPQLPLGGMPMAPVGPPPEVLDAQAVLQDFQEGMARRKQVDGLARTLTILFSHSMLTQQPLDFKMALKQVVRRASTAKVGYVELDFQREMGPREGVAEQMEDYRQRIEHLQGLIEDAQEGEITEYDAEMADLKYSLQALASEPEIVVNEGLVFDYPRATKVIPDKALKSLVGWVGANHLTIEYEYSVERVEEMFGVDLGKNYTPYKSCSDTGDNETSANDVDDWIEDKGNARSTADMVRVWKHFDKASGLVYFLADGYPKWLKEPAPPNVFVESFFPVRALTFNECESEDEPFPPSDVQLLEDMQEEINRSRQGKREHRNAARPRWVSRTGALGEDDKTRLSKAQPFTVTEMNLGPGEKAGDVFDNFPVPGVDPNLYDTNEVFADFQLVGGMQQAQLGGMSNATATESSISANASATSDGSNVDDLDSFLTHLARDGGAILLKEMSEEKVKEIVGPGAVWPHMTLAEIAGEVWLEIEAGSTGRPNQAVEINNWKTLLPFLLQIPTIKPDWLARETIKRLDDRLELTDAIDPNLPSIMAMGRLAGQQPNVGDPTQSPDQQGPEGGDKTPAPKGQPTGTDAPMGDNRGQVV